MFDFLQKLFYDKTSDEKWKWFGSFKRDVCFQAPLDEVRLPDQNQKNSLLQQLLSDPDWCHSCSCGVIVVWPLTLRGYFSHNRSASSNVVMLRRSCWMHKWCWRSPAMHTGTYATIFLDNVVECFVCWSPDAAVIYQEDRFTRLRRDVVRFNGAALVQQRTWNMLGICYCI